MSNVAAKVRARKLLRPSDYCANSKCLWRTVTSSGFKPCPRHGDLSKTISSATEVDDIPSPAERMDSEYDAP